MRGPLPVYITDPVARLRFVKKAMDGLKESKQAVGAATLAAVNEMAPPTILAQASRLNFSTRLFNLIVTNIPGPQFPLYVLGRQLQDLYPVAFLPRDHALAVAIMSYNGGLDYGLLADYDAVPDIDVIADGIRETLDELLLAAEGRTATVNATASGEARRGRRSGKAAAGGAGARNGSSEGAKDSNGRSVPILPTGSGRSHRGPAADMRAKRGRRTARSRRSQGS